MSLASLSDQRVGVLREPFSFVVTVDAQPVLRCTVRRDAFRYAVMVRRALRQAEHLRGESAAPSSSPASARRLRPRGRVRH